MFEVMTDRAAVFVQTTWSPLQRRRGGLRRQRKRPERSRSASTNSCLKVTKTHSLILLVMIMICCIKTSRIYIFPLLFSFFLQQIQTPSSNEPSLDLCYVSKSIKRNYFHVTVKCSCVTCGFGGGGLLSQKKYISKQAIRLFSKLYSPHDSS